MKYKNDRIIMKYRSFREEGWSFLQGTSSQERVQTLLLQHSGKWRSDGEWIGHMPRCKIFPGISCTDLAKQGELPHLKDKLRSWCCKSPTATTCNTTSPSTGIMLWLKEDSWPQAWLWEMKNISPLRDDSMKENESLSRNALCWTTLHT